MVNLKLAFSGFNLYCIEIIQPYLNFLRKNSKVEVNSGE